MTKNFRHVIMALAFMVVGLSLAYIVKDHRKAAHAQEIRALTALHEQQLEKTRELCEQSWDEKFQQGKLEMAETLLALCAKQEHIKLTGGILSCKLIIGGDVI